MSDVLRELMEEEEEAAMAARRAMERHLVPLEAPVNPASDETRLRLVDRYRAAYWRHRRRVTALAAVVGGSATDGPDGELFAPLDAAERRATLRVIENPGFAQ